MSTSEPNQELERMGSVEEEKEAVFEDLLERRLVIIGKTGNGKSSIGNLILGKRHFRVGFSMSSTTVCVASGSACVGNRKIKVVDTPDISNLPAANEDDAQREVNKWKAMTSSHPHAILLAVRCDVRYTLEEYGIFTQLRKLWGSQALNRRLIVAFTFGDRQDNDLEEDLRKVCPELKSVLKDASNRHILLNDKDSDQAKQEKVSQLMSMVDVLEEEALKEERRLLTGCRCVLRVPSSCPHLALPCIAPLPGDSKHSRGSSSSDNYIKLVLVGKPGTGKSSTGNSIVGKAVFQVNHNSQASFHTSTMEEVSLEGLRIQVVDTPGLRNDLQDKEYQRARRRASELVMPGLHALLFVVRHGNVTEEDLKDFRSFKEGAGRGLSHHTVVVLVGAPPTQASSSPPEASQLGQGTVFSSLLQEAGSKLWVVNNKEDDVEARQRQVKTLMGLVKGILDNSGGNYFHGDKEAREFRNKKDKSKAERSSCWFL